MNRFGLFRIRGAGFAIPLAQILRILEGAEKCQLPRLPGAVTAVLVDEDRLVPLIDLGCALGVGDDCSTPGGYQILVESEYGVVALVADSSGRIVAEKKGHILPLPVKEQVVGVVGRFSYQNDVYNILDIDFLAIEMTQAYWQNQSDTGGARRHQ